MNQDRRKGKMAAVPSVRGQDTDKTERRNNTDELPDVLSEMQKRDGGERRRIQNNHYRRARRKQTQSRRFVTITNHKYRLVFL